MKKTMNCKNVSYGVVLGLFILIMTLTIGNVSISHQESKTLNSGKITFIADDNNAFSDLSRNMTVQKGTGLLGSHKYTQIGCNYAIKGSMLHTSYSTC